MQLLMGGGSGGSGEKSEEEGKGKEAAGRPLWSSPTSSAGAADLHLALCSPPPMLPFCLLEVEKNLEEQHQSSDQ